MIGDDVAISVKNVALDYPMLKDGKRFIKERITKRFKKGANLFRALTNVSIDIQKGEVVGLIGPNGAGKSTLLRMMAGIIPPDEGEIWTRGRVDLLAGVGAGMQGNLSGIENVELSGSIYGMSKQEIADKIEEIIEFSGVGKFISQPVRTYSSGMKARLGFSISAHICPDILLIDEVFAVGDASFGRKSRSKITELIQGGSTVVIVSHDVQAIQSLCSRAYFMSKGEVCSTGDLNEAVSMYNQL